MYINYTVLIKATTYIAVYSETGKVFNDKVSMKERKAGKTKMLHKAAPLSVNRKSNIGFNDLLHQKQVSPLNVVFVKS